MTFTPDEVSVIDQQIAESRQLLDAYIRAHKVDREKHGETAAICGLAQILFAISRSPNQGYHIANMLAVSIDRMIRSTIPTDDLESMFAAPAAIEPQKAIEAPNVVETVDYPSWIDKVHDNVEYEDD